MRLRCAAKEAGKPCPLPVASNATSSWPLCDKHLREAQVIIDTALHDDEGSTA